MKKCRGPCALLTGKLYRDGAEIRREIEQEIFRKVPSLHLNMLVPVIVLLVFILWAVHTGDIKTNGFFGALAAGSFPACWIPPSFWPPSPPPSSWGHDQQGLEPKALSTFIEGLHGHDGGPDDPHAGLGHRQHLLRLRHFHFGSSAPASESFPDPHLYVCAIIFIATCLTSFLHRQLLERIRHLHPHRRASGHLHRCPL